MVELSSEGGPGGSEETLYHLATEIATMELTNVAGSQVAAYHHSSPYVGFLSEAARSYAQGLGVGYDPRKLHEFQDAVGGIHLDGDGGQVPTVEPCRIVPQNAATPDFAAYWWGF